MMPASKLFVMTAAMVGFTAAFTALESGPDSSPPVATHGSIVGIKGPGPTMKVHCFLGTAPVIKQGENDLRWKTCEVATSGGEIESVVAEHGLSAVVKGTTVVGIGDLSGSGKTYPSGLAMTITFSDDTNMDEVMIDFTSPDTAIVMDDPAVHPTVAFASRAPNGRVATVVQDTRHDIYAFAPGVPINTIEMEADMSNITVAAIQKGLSAIASPVRFGLGFLDGSGKAIDQEVPVAASSAALAPILSEVTHVTIQSKKTPPPEFDYMVIVIGAVLEEAAYKTVEAAESLPEK